MGGPRVIMGHSRGLPDTPRMTKVALVANTDWYLCNFRLSLAEMVRREVRPCPDIAARPICRGVHAQRVPLARMASWAPIARAVE